MEFPIKKIKIDLSGYCNEKCDFCPYHGVGREVEDKDFIDSVLLKDLAEQLSGLEKKPIIRFAGSGEPTLHPDFSEILSYFGEKDFDVRLITNGLRINEHFEAITAYIKKLVVSIHGNETTHDLLTRRQGAYQQATDNIRILVDMKPDIDIVMHMVLTPQNIDEIVDHAINASELGVRARYQHMLMTEENVKLGYMDDVFVRKRIKETKEKYPEIAMIPELSEEQIIEYYDVSKPFIRNRHHCQPVTDDIHVRFDGEVMMCDSKSFGNLYDENIISITNSAKRNEFIKMILSRANSPSGLLESLCSRCCYQ